MISSDIFKDVILSNFEFSSTLCKNENEYCITIKELNLKITGESENAVKANMINRVKNISRDYIDRADFYLRHPDKKKTEVFPYYLRLLYCETDNDLLDIINIKTLI